MSESTLIEVGIPPLEEGQQLDRVEFRRRYEAMPHVKRAELLEGIVYMPSPVKHSRHGGPHGLILWWLNSYRTFTPGLDSSDNATVELDDDNEPQPDAVLFILPEHGGAVRMVDDYIVNGPELAVEVSYSRVHVDLGPRQRVYQSHGVREYIVWRTDSNEILWFVLRDAAYVRLMPDEAGIIRSEVFPGLWLNSPALPGLDLPGVFATLQTGLATPEHAAFVARLQQHPTGGQP